MQIRIDDLMKLIHTWLRAITVDVENIKENFQPTSILMVINKAVESVEPHAIRKDISIQTLIEDDIPTVNGDEGTLVEAVVNIVGNAVKYSPTGSQISITATRSDAQVMIKIQDNGIGIAKEDLPFIFEDFYTVKSNQNVERGSGVGLALTRRILEAHEGTIFVESELGKGSIFEMCLPVGKELSVELNQTTKEPVNNI
jgi:two-component system sensor histidine kinase VicK